MPPEGVPPRLWQDFLAIRTAKRLPLTANALADIEHDLDEDTLVCGDRKADRERIAELLGLIPGLRPVHGGPLEYSRYAEQLTPLLIGINSRYKTHAGIRFTNLPE